MVVSGDRGGEERYVRVSLSRKPARARLTSPARKGVTPCLFLSSGAAGYRGKKGATSLNGGRCEGDNALTAIRGPGFTLPGVFAHR